VPTGRNDKTSSLIHTAYALTIAAFYAASFFPEARLWGINWFGFFGWPGPVILLVLGLLLFYLVSLVRLSAESSQKRNSYPLTAVAVVLFFAVCFHLFRGRTHFLGDGYQILDWLAYGWSHNKPWAAGVHEVQYWIYLAVKGLSEHSALLAAQLYSYISGLIFIAASAIVAGRLFERTFDRMILLLGLCSGGHMLLYFGYVENYPLFVSVVGVFSLMGLLVARGRLSRAWLLIPLAVAVALHIFGVVLIPAALYLTLRETSIGRKIAALLPAVRWSGAAVVVAVAIAAFVYVYTNSFFFRFTIVPFVDGPLVVESYTMFSTAHLLDFGNLLWQHAPPLLLFIVAWFTLPARALLARPDYRFLILLLAASLAMAFVFQPGLGMPRDWDLFSFPAVPLTLLGFYIILDNRNRLAGYAAISTLALGLGFLLLAPRVAVQIIPEKGIAAFERMASLDEIRNRKGRSILIDYLEKRGDTVRAEQLSERCAVWYPQEHWYEEGRILTERGDREAAVERLRDAVNFDPTHGFAWAGLGLYHYNRGQYDSALTCWQIATAVTPFNSDHVRQLGMGYAAVGDTARAESCWLKAAAMDSSDVTPLIYLVGVYRTQQREEEYSRLLEELVARPDVPLGILIEYADHRAFVGEFEAAREGFRRALSHGIDTAFVRERERQYPGLEVLDQ